jgi:hypothetical protein
VAASIALSSGAALADETGVSFWLPGIYGSLAALPQHPGWSFSATYYHTSVSAGLDVARAREISIGRFDPTLRMGMTGSVNAKADLELLNASYVFANPVLGGQAAVGLMAPVGRASTSLDATLFAALGPFAVVRSDSITQSATGFGDLYPMFSLRWNQGVHNFMTYLTGDVPVGAYDPTRIANLGIGHGAIDGGGGYTYFNPQTGHEFSAVAGFTYNFENTHTNYQSGVDFHLDWGASQFLTKQLQLGLVGYAYDQVGCDSGSGNRVGCFQSRVLGFGPQLGYIVPLGEHQAYINLKGYKEFDAANRPDGWNVWLTLAITPAAAPPPVAAPRPMITK